MALGRLVNLVENLVCLEDRRFLVELLTPLCALLQVFATGRVDVHQRCDHFIVVNGLSDLHRAGKGARWYRNLLAEPHSRVLHR